ncbi:MAG: SH3 domain-containing protein [Gammaproteobacteria bacterium]|nr:SH3 domain-containing protein [Gammaproteobacteria bacterium]
MKSSRLAAACAAAVAMGLSMSAMAKVENTKGSTKTAEIPVCGKVLGTIALVDGDGQGWKAYQLGAPSTLLKTFISKSGCFKLVNRGAGMEAIQREQALAGEGNLQRGSNVGGGQIKSADWLLVADVAGQNQNSGGSAVGAIAGGMLGSRFGGLGALAGGIKTTKVEAQTVISLVNTRTSEEEYNIEGFAKKSDFSWGAGGFAGWAGAGGGAYASTDVGKVVGLAFLDAYRQLVTQMGGLNADVVASAPRQSFVAISSAEMKRSPSKSSSTVRTLDSGMMVYPLGGKEDMWWEVEDENGNVGWVLNDKLAPKK